MHILFCHDAYYSVKRDGTVLSYGSFPYKLWEHRYLTHFESMTIIGRKKKLSPHETGALDISSGKNIEHILLANIDSTVKRLTKYNSMYKKIEKQVIKSDAVIVRGPVEFSMMAAKAARKHNKPYAVEMCGCAYDKTYFKHKVFSKIYAPIKYRKAQKMVRNADAVLYVTEKFLQSRYPTNGISQYASNVEIAAPPEYVITSRLKHIEENSGKLNIGMIGSFYNGLKGINVAIEALGIVKKYISENSDKKLPDFHFKILGQGIAAQWQGLINENNLKEEVEFCGIIARGKDVSEWLDDIDIYIQPSYHTALPRSLIEAMSRGCPALSSNAGGSCELLESKFLHERGDAQTLAKEIITLMDKKERIIAANNNFNKAKNYTSEELIPRKNTFWENFAQIVKSKNCLE